MRRQKLYVVAFFAFSQYTGYSTKPVNYTIFNKDYVFSTHQNLHMSKKSIIFA